MNDMDKMYEIVKALINNINYPPNKIEKRQVWRLPLLKPSIYLLVMWCDEEYARVIPLMKRAEVPRDLVSKNDIMFSDNIISLSNLGVVAFPKKVQIIPIKKIKNFTYVGELEKNNFRVIHYADHNDYSLVDNKKYFRADLGMILKNEN